MKQLSICIPTYNRRTELETLLNSIASQINEGITQNIEIVISDNNSNDDTDEFIERYKSKNNKLDLRYFKNDKNIGADNNFLRVVELSDAKYCWIVGSDDRIKKGSIETVLEEIKSKNTIYISSRDNFDRDMKKKIGHTDFFIKEINTDTTIQIDSKDSLKNYFRICNGLGGLMSYLSSIVFNKKDWDSIKNESEYIGTAYIHCYKLLSVLNNYNATIRILKKPLVDCRYDNDSFFQNFAQRTFLDLDGFIKLSRIYNDELIKRDFFDAFNRSFSVFPFKVIISMNREQFNQFISKLQYMGYSNEMIDEYKRMYSHKILTVLLHSDKVISYLKRKL